MRRRNLAAMLCVLLAPIGAAADGGRLVLRETRGARVVNLLVAPTPVRVGPAAFDVLLQSSATGEPILGERVQIRLSGPGHHATQELDARPETGTNRFFFGANATLPMAGPWRIEVLVDAPTGAETFRTTIVVAPPLPPALRYWPYIAMTPLGAALLAIHQTRVFRRAGAGARSKSEPE